MASQPFPTTLQSDNVRTAVAEVKTLTVDRLKKILRAENLTVSGIKSELQVRLIAHIQRCADTGDFAHIDRIRSSIKVAVHGYPLSPLGLDRRHYSDYTHTTPSAPPTSRNHHQLTTFPMASYPPTQLRFKQSPFYTITKSLSAITELKAREQTRDTARINLRLGHMEIDQLQRDSNARVMVFCAAENLAASSELQDVAFPMHGELKCNADDVRHNLKGMKGKPGTTRPADITQYIRKTSSFPNSVELVYALTTRKYYLVVNLVQKSLVENLVSEIKYRRTPFSKDRVVREMQSKADDPDIVATSTNMSLKDPLQMTRIQTPCRGMSCSHNGCFDAAVYLALQEQAPQWSCPICHKPVPWDQIAYDQYFADILQNVDEDTEQVTVEPDGRWHRGETTSTDQTAPGQKAHDEDDSDDDDDIVEITNHNISRPHEAASSPYPRRTPPLHSMSVTPVPNSASSNTSMSFPPPDQIPPRSTKRPHSETIDLTLDDSDEDQPPIARIKRPSLSSQPSDPFRIRPQDNDAFRFRMPPPPSANFDPTRFTGF